jgi:hypothetical protein
MKLTADGRRECLSCSGPRCPTDGCPVRWRSGVDRLCIEHRLDDETLDRIVASMFGRPGEDDRSRRW